MIDDSFEGDFAHELSQMIRQQRLDRNTTIIIAGNPDHGDELKKTSGADKFVAKPLTGRSLRTTPIESGKYSVTH
jgi:hypothetical protein